VGEPVDIQTDKRYVQHIRGHAIGDIYDALVELITNSDDSYNRIFRKGKREEDGGPIVIEHLEQRKGQPSFVVVRDNAEGMNSDDMDRCLRRIGAYVSTEGSRGYMGRGAKDCTELGQLTYESIKDGRYFRCKITKDLKFVLEQDGKPATRDLRRRLAIPTENGTSVTLELGDGVHLPRFDSIKTDLPWHFALRDIAATDSKSSLFLQRTKGNDDPHRLLFRPPDGQLVLDEKYDVPGYTGARAWVRIWRADEPLDESRPRFERCGLIVKGQRAIHECSLLDEELKRNPHARRYFGRIVCPHIDGLMQDYEKRLKSNQAHPQENPRLLIDPNRRYGLERRHPFVRALFETPVNRLKGLVAKDTAEEKAQQREVASHETKARLDKLAKLAGRFLRDELEDMELIGDGEVDQEAFAKRGAAIYPTYLNVAVGKERSLTLYVHRSAFTDVTRPITIVSDNDEAVEIDGSPFVLRPHRDKEDRLVGVFKVRGLQVCSSVVLSVLGEERLPKTEALVQVVPDIVEQHDFVNPLEFEREDYRIRLGKRKTIRLFARYPELVAKETKVEVKSEDNEKVAVRGKCVLVPVVGSNYAEAAVSIEARTLRARITINADVGSHKAVTTVRVIDRSEDEGVPLKFELRDQDFGNFRAMWATLEGKPNLLLISARHKSLSRYLGTPPEFQGQDSAHFRVLLAEIVAERVCRRLLTEEARMRPNDYELSRSSHDAIEEVFGFFARRMKEFLPIAHSAMLDDSEQKIVNAPPK
jgi:hypothetical protein